MKKHLIYGITFMAGASIPCKLEYAWALNLFLYGNSAIQFFIAGRESVLRSK